jgi:NhaA family Na+:H+ antiporter
VRVLRPLQQFFRLEAASGIVLLAAAAAALLWANFAAGYEPAFAMRVAGVTLREGVNDVLMTLFFFLVGMEMKRELVLGELRTFGRAALPAVGALGGMIVPAAVYLALNRAPDARAGWGVPMATDIAFCIGVLTLLRSRVPQGLIVFLTALAIFDDIGGIVVIALFYGQGVHAGWLLGAVALAVLAFAAGRAQVSRGVVWAALGAALWFAMHHSGIHATLAGVAIGLAVPAHVPGGREAPLTRFVRLLHPYVAFAVMPLFALANSGVSLRSVGLSDIGSGITLGIGLGLFAGKQVGIFAFTLIAVALGLAPIPGHASRAKLLGVSVVGGIGFTVALFIAALAFRDERLLAQAKLGILGGSVVAGLVGSAILAATSRVHRDAA